MGKRKTRTARAGCVLQTGQIRLTYDENGNLTGVTDAWGNTTRYAYDSLNRRIRSTGTPWEETHYEYDDADRLCAVTDALGNRTEYTYRGRREADRNADIGRYRGKALPITP